MLFTFPVLARMFHWVAWLQVPETGRLEEREASSPCHAECRWLGHGQRGIHVSIFIVIDLDAQY